MIPNKNNIIITALSMGSIVKELSTEGHKVYN